MGQAESRQEQFWEACGFGNAQKVQQFINEGVDVNWVSKTHDSCPIHAASQGKPEIVIMLIEAGCDVNARDERKCTALHHACMNGFTDCVKLLLQAGAVVNVEDKNMWTPLHNAAYWAHPGVVEMLLSHKADITMKNKDERLPIHEVARSKSTDEECVGKSAELLIKYGCDVEARAGTVGFSEFTVLMFASYHGHVSVVRHLLEARCEVNAQSSNKWTALHWASDRSHTKIVELLLESDADPSILGDRSELARDRATCDDVRAIFDRIMHLASATGNSKPDKNDLIDISQFPAHLKEPDSISKADNETNVDIQHSTQQNTNDGDVHIEPVLNVENLTCDDNNDNFPDNMKLIKSDDASEEDVDNICSKEIQKDDENKSIPDDVVMEPLPVDYDDQGTPVAAAGTPVAAGGIA